MTAKKSYTAEQLNRINQDIPASMRYSEVFARNSELYSAAMSRAQRKRGSQAEDPRHSFQRTINNATSRAPYEGQELRRLCVREGAYKAIDAPSLRDGQRHAPQAPFCSP